MNVSDIQLIWLAVLIKRDAKNEQNRKTGNVTKKKKKKKGKRKKERKKRNQGLPKQFKEHLYNGLPGEELTGRC